MGVQCSSVLSEFTFTEAELCVKTTVKVLPFWFESFFHLTHWNCSISQLHINHRVKNISNNHKNTAVCVLRCGGWLRQRISSEAFIQAFLMLCVIHHTKQHLTQNLEETGVTAPYQINIKNVHILSTLLCKVRCFDMK